MAGITGIIGRWAMVFPFALALLGCGSQAQIIKEASSPSRPSWIATHPTDSREFRYFVGVRTGASTLEEGIDSSIKDASGRIAGFLKSQVKSEFEETTTQVEQNLKQQISARSTAVVSGAKVVEWYNEKTTRIDRGFKAERHDVWVLVSYPQGEVARELERQAVERQAIAGKALGWYRKGEREEKAKRYANARESYTKALDELNGLDEVTPVGGEFGDSATLARAAKEKSSELTRRSRRLAIKCRVKGNDESYRQFVASLSETIISGEIEVGNDDPAYEVRGVVTVTYAGHVMGNYASYAKGSLEIRQIIDGKILSVISLHAKGFHRQRDMADLNALKEGGEQAGELVVKAILDTESR